MKKLINLILILLCFQSWTLFAQEAKGSRLKDITKLAAEGNECKEILIERNKQIRLRDSALLKNRISDSIHVFEKKILTNEITILQSDNDDLFKENQKINKNSHRKNTAIFVLIFVVVIQQAVNIITK